MNARPARLRMLPLAGVSLALAFAALPLAGKVVGWVIVGLLAALVARLILHHRGAKSPSVTLKLALLAVAVGGVAASFGTLVGPEAGLSALLALIALKVLESDTPRDLQVLALVGYFLCLCSLFFSQEMLLWLYLAAIMVLLTATLILFHRGAESGGVGRSVRLAGKLLAQALPLAVLLFLVFPRSSGGFRFQFGRAILGNQGISDRLAPGSVAGLAQSDTVVLRAEFPDGTIPSAEDMYWRGAVLWHCGGLNWSRGPRLSLEFGGQQGGPAIRQRISMQPHGERWVFALDRPSDEPPRTALQPGAFLHSDRPLSNAFHYTVNSRPENRETRLPLDHAEAALALPPTISTAVRALAASWTANATSGREIVNAALRHFRNERFTYTLEPGTYGEDGLDEFLFQRRAGFCEHYAATFATLMRAAGLPARIVVGYHGGQYNTVGHYVIVRQYHAHAWCEVFLQGSGWVRIDPTDAIAPERVSSALSAGRGYSSDAQRAGGESGSGGAWGRLARAQIILAWDSVNYRWDLHVQSYNDEQQRTWLAVLGLPRISWLGLLAWCTVAIGICLAVLALWHRWPRAQPRDPAEREYERLCRQLAAAGIARAPWEGPRTFTERAARAFPDHAEFLRRCGELYVNLRYGRTPPASREFTDAVRRFPRLSPIAAPASMPAPR